MVFSSSLFAFGARVTNPVKEVAAAADQESAFALKNRRSRFLAALGMTGGDFIPVGGSGRHRRAFFHPPISLDDWLQLLTPCVKASPPQRQQPQSRWLQTGARRRRTAHLGQQIVRYRAGLAGTNGLIRHSLVSVARQRELAGTETDERVEPSPTVVLLSLHRKLEAEKAPLRVSPVPAPVRTTGVAAYPFDHDAVGSKLALGPNTMACCQNRGNVAVAEP